MQKKFNSSEKEESIRSKGRRCKKGMVLEQFHGKAVSFTGGCI
jgi:hypothetical protein